MISGGYGQFANGLASIPTPLDIRYNHCIERIDYSRDEGRSTPEMEDMPITITCNNGDTVRADAVVVTVSLGVLKSGAITFDPALPECKKGAISRLGFGLLNKVPTVINCANTRLFLYMTDHSGTQMRTLSDAFELQKREILNLMIHTSIAVAVSILSGIALRHAEGLPLV